jgi:hypothetical protein
VILKWLLPQKDTYEFMSREGWHAETARSAAAKPWNTLDVCSDESRFKVDVHVSRYERARRRTDALRVALEVIIEQIDKFADYPEIMDVISECVCAETAKCIEHLDAARKARSSVASGI